MDKKGKILVTGGAGFIGANFVKFLLRSEPRARIINFDALTYAGNIENLSDVLGDSRHEFVHGDIRDKAGVGAVFARGGIACVINFAAESHVDRSLDSPDSFVQTNVLGCLNLLEAARRHGVARFVQISTDEVYGSLLPGEAAFTEESPIRPNSPYSASKASADHLARAYHHSYGLDTVVTRCSNNYGPMQFPEKMIPLCINNAFNGRKIPVYGDGMQVRDWLHVEDHCSAVWEVCRKGRAGEVYNIGGACQTTNLDLVRAILRECGRDESLVSFVKDRPGHDRRYAMDFTKLNKETGWKPRHEFEKGLADTVKWYSSNKGWLEHVSSGEYKGYYEKMYSNR